MDFVLVVGKYFFLALLYLFVFLIYRTILRDVGGGVRAGGADVRHAASDRPRAPQPVEPLLPVGRPEPPLVTDGVSGPDMAMSAADGARLVVVQSADPERLHVGSELRLSSATAVGRGAENAIVLPDRFVSAQHALVYLSQGRHVLRDRDSTNGTFVNGQRVHSDIVLNTGDRLELGTTILEYRQ